MADVARAAGVSKMTVSRVLNNKGEISEATRQKVLSVIEALSYMPHVPAQRLGTGESRTIALLYPLLYLGNQPINLLELDFIVGAATAAGEENYFFNLLALPVTQESLLGMYRTAQVDGVVLMQIHLHDWRVDRLREHHYPFVMIGRCADNTDLSLVDLDFEAALLSAFDYLVELGHCRIGFLGYPADMRRDGYGPAVRSMAGYQKALQKYALAECCREVHFNIQSMFEATLELFAQEPGLTAIVISHDVAVFGVLRALRHLERRVPEDVSIIGVTTDKVAELLTPPLTAIRFPTYEMGYEATKMLIAKLKGEPGEPRQVLIPPQLRLRKSTRSVT